MLIWEMKGTRLSVAEINAPPDKQEFRQLQRTGQFELTWLVPTEAKKRSLEIAVANLSSLSFTLQAFAVPEVLEILAPLQPHHSPTLRV